MRRFSLLLVVVLAGAAFAQTAPQDSEPAQQAQPASNYGIAPAPKPGHPLDPNDVAVLTGKTAQLRQGYVAPQIYYSYPTGGSMFTQSRVGNAFRRQPNFFLGYGNRWQGTSGNWGWGPYYSGSNFNGSQFADVSTETNPFHLRRTRKPGFAPNWFFGHGSPGLVNRWRPNLWLAPRTQEKTATTGSKSSPGPRP